MNRPEASEWLVWVRTTMSYLQLSLRLADLTRVGPGEYRLIRCSRIPELAAWSGRDPIPIKGRPATKETCTKTASTVPVGGLPIGDSTDGFPCCKSAHFHSCVGFSANSSEPLGGNSRVNSLELVRFAIRNIRRNCRVFGAGQQPGAFRQIATARTK